MRALRPGALVLAFLVCGASGARAQSGAPASGGPQRTTLDGVYTPQQAARGEKLSRQECSACHAPQDWSRPAFLNAWTGRTARDLFENLRTTMPYDFPGRLGRQQYADVVAYILRLNGFPSGDAELRPDDASLGRILIQRAKE